MYSVGHPIMLLRYADKCIVNNILKVYIETNTLQLKLIRYSKKKVYIYSRLFLRSDGFATERIAGRFEHKPLRLCFGQSCNTILTCYQPVTNVWMNTLLQTYCLSETEGWIWPVFGCKRYIVLCSDDICTFSGRS